MANECLLADKLSISKTCVDLICVGFGANGGGEMKTTVQHLQHNDLCRLAHDSFRTRKNKCSQFGCVCRALIPFSINARKQPNNEKKREVCIKSPPDFQSPPLKCLLHFISSCPHRKPQKKIFFDISSQSIDLLVHLYPCNTTIAPSIHSA